MPKTIVIDSFIGPFAYSKQFIRSMLDEAKDEAVEVTISSLGGSVDHAIAIHDMFATRGNISVNMTGFIASAATFIGLPCPTRISENSFYLIHKVLSWVDVFGSMNEDDIEQVIEKLTKEKDENAKMTLVLAQRYAERAATKGKTIQDVLDLMKKDTWLTAQEALEWGFVDEVYKPQLATNFAEEYKMVAMINAAGLPNLPRYQSLGPIGISGGPGLLGTDGSNKPVGADLQSVSNEQFNSTSNQNQEEMITKAIVLPKVNEILNIAELAISDEGSFLNEEQLTSIEDKLQEYETIAADRDNVAAQLQSLTTEREAHIQLIADTTAERDTLNQSVIDLTAERDNQTAQITQLNEQILSLTTERDTLNQANEEKQTRLAKLPAARAIVLQATNDPVNAAQGPDWDTINSLPHNKFVDNN